MQFRSFNRTNITLEACRDFTYGFLNGFSSDPLISSLFPANYQFSETIYKALPNVAKEDMNRYKRLENLMAHEVMAMHLGGDVITNNIYDDKGTVSAVSMWQVPEHSSMRTPLSLLQRASIWVISRYWRIRYSLPFWIRGEKAVCVLTDPGIVKWVKDAIQSSDAYATPKKIATLAQLGDHQLEEAIYPVSSLYYLEFLAVTIQGRRQGLGSALLKYAEENLEPAPVTFKSGSNLSHGPTKMSLLSSKMGMKLYEKAGFVLKYSDTSTLPEIHYFEKVMNKSS